MNEVLDVYQKCMADRNQSEAYKLLRIKQWDQNYRNYRAKPTLNRITQTQNISSDLTKKAINTAFANMNDTPTPAFTCLDGGGVDDTRSILKNKLWKQEIEPGLTLKDRIDKKNNLLYGRSFYKINVDNGRVVVDNVDPYDIEIDPLIEDKSNIDTANYIIHKNIMVPLGELYRNEKFNKGAIQKIGKKIAKGEVTPINLYSEAMTKREERLRSIGYVVENNEINDSDIVDVWEDYRKETDDKGVTRIVLYVLCEGECLYKANLRDLLYPELPEDIPDFYPFTSWAYDIDGIDFWSDGIADIIRPYHEAHSIFLSQGIQNAIFRGFGMNWYDNTVDPDFDPSSYQPYPFALFGVPGKPSEIIERINIADNPLDANTMNYLENVAMSVSATPSQIQGVAQPGVATLGEAQIIQQNSEKRLSDSAIEYNENMRRLAEKWSYIIDYNPELQDVILTEIVGDNAYQQEVSTSMFASDNGYKVVVSNSFDKEKDDITTVQKMVGVASVFQNNQAFQTIMKDKALDVLDLTAEQRERILNEEKLLEEQGQGGNIANMQSMKEVVMNNPDLQLDQKGENL